MALPVTLPYHDDEAAIDLVARLAIANGYPSLRAFLAHTDTTANAIVHGELDALAFVGNWSGVSVARLGQLAAMASGSGGTWRMGCATLSKDMRPGRMQRFCAHCLLEDREKEAGRLASRAYRRAWRSIRAIEGCPVHGCGLSEVAVDADGDVHDFPRFVNANLASIEQAGAAPIPSRQPGLDRYLRDRVFRLGGDSLLDRLDAHVAVEFSRYLGDLLTLHDIKAWMQDETDLREWGSNLAVKGEVEVGRVLAEVIDQKRPTTQYVEPVIGPMAEWLRRNAAKEAYGPVIDLMQDVLERNMPFGEGQVIFKPVQTRHVYCVNSAQADYGINKDRIRALMQADDPGFRDGLSDGRTYFDAASSRPMLEAARETLNSREAGETLGVSEEMVHGLLGAGILEQVEKRSEDKRAFVRIHRTVLDRLIQSLTKKSTVVSDAEGLLSVSSAVSASRRPFHRLVKMVLDGDLNAFIVSSDGPIFERVLIPAIVLKSSNSCELKVFSDPLAGGTAELMRLKEAELALGTTTITIVDLLKRGYLRQ